MSRLFGGCRLQRVGGDPSDRSNRRPIVAKYYIPSRDGDFRAWLRNFVTVLSALAVALGIPMPDVTDVSLAADQAEGAMDDHVAAQAIAEAKRQAKTAKRAEAESLARALVKRIQA